MDSIDFLSLEWFYPSTLRSFTWTNSLFLYALLLVPITLLPIRSLAARP